MGALLFKGFPDTAEQWRQELKRHIPDLEVRMWPDVGDRNDIDVALVHMVPHGEFKTFPNLKAILYLGAGVESLLADPHLPDVPMARMVDPNLNEQMTSYIQYGVLRYHRRFDYFEHLQREKRWQYVRGGKNSTCRVGIMGLGVLGADAALGLQKMGFTVSGWSRSPKTLADVQTFHGPDQFQSFLSQTDILCCLLPLTPATKNILNAKTLAQLPRGARIINTARGNLIVESDLLDALRSGHIAGAMLDVFSKEPLPPEHPFWEEPNVTITCHSASNTSPVTAAPLVCENIRRARRGEPLLYPVSVDKGY